MPCLLLLPSIPPAYVVILSNSRAAKGLPIPREVEEREFCLLKQARSHNR